MKRKTVRFFFIGAGIFVLFIAGSGYYMYNFTQGSEHLTGKRQSIPEKPVSSHFIAKGSSDWSSWQGENFDKKVPLKVLKKTGRMA